MASANQFNGALDALADLNRKLVELYLSRSTAQGPLNQVLMQANMNDANRFFEHAFGQPNALVEQQLKWWQQQLELSQHAVLRLFGQPSEPVIQPDRSDRRFTSDEWQQNILFDYLKQSYLLTTQNVLGSINQLETLDEETRKRLEFFTRQYLSALSPSNYLLSNPELLKVTLENNGQNLVKGMELLVEDMEKSADTLNIRMTDQSSFRPGDNLATTPGKVIFRNHLFELIQYVPTTEEVLQRPLLIVPPFINKFYILDLQAQNSFVRWAVSQGHTVFMMSWVNATPELKDITFEDYVIDGVLAALDAIETATGEKEVNGIGYCIGGTLLSVTMAYLAARRMKQRIRTGTLFTTLLDFAKPGDIGVFINEETVSAVETQNQIKGYMDGRQIAVSFSLLRENSLYWNYFVDNYLKGKSPMAFDILYWNCDSTNVPAACHNFLLRQCYLENQLIMPGGISIRGTAIDLNKIKLPLYFLSAAEDHIALWDATYDGAKVIGKDNSHVTFVLGESGHIAGVVNPPEKGKYGYWCNPDNSFLPDDSQAWLNAAEHHKGSWWPHWQQWLVSHLPEGSKPVPARQPVARENQPLLGDAPGEYVKVRISGIDQQIKASLLHPSSEESAEENAA